MNITHTHLSLCIIIGQLRTAEALLTTALEEAALLDNKAADHIGAAIEQAAQARVWLDSWRRTIADAGVAQ